MVIDVDAAREDTEGVRHVTHLDHAGSSLAPRPVADTVVAHLRREEQIGGYRAAAEATDRLDGVYSSLARLVGASPDEVAVLESGSTAWTTAVSGLPLAGRRVLLGRGEYWHNVLVLRRLARQHDLELVVLDDDEHGRVDVDHLDRELDRGDVALVAVTHLAMGGGPVQPAAEVGVRCRAAGVTFVLDACQSAGQMPLDVAEFGCDIMVGTGRKFLRGPRGTAFLYVRRRLLDMLGPDLRDLHPWAGGFAGRDARVEARMLESWETSVAGRLGLGRAVDYALDLGLEAIRDRVTALAGTMRRRLAELPSVRVHDQGLVLPGIVLFSVRGRTAEQVGARLAGHGINVSAAALPPSASEHVLHPVGTEAVAVRASVHYYNTEEEIGRLVRALS